jgi:hypothetical protein
MKMIMGKIKAMNYKTRLTISLLLISSGLVYGQPFSEKRIFYKAACVKKETILEISNKYGTIHVTSWKSDSVSIRAEIEASASSQSKLGKMFEGVNINISESNLMVRAQTSFIQNINMLFESFKGMTNKLIPYESKIQINYFINAPDYLNLKIENKYGDVYMEDNTSTFSITLSNGSFKANSLNDVTGMNFAFCDATINNINIGKIDATFSEVAITESKNLIIKSVSSRFELKKAGMVDVNSRKDKFFIGSLVSIRGSSYFTDYRIEKLEIDIDLVSKYGSINASFIEKSVELISINSGYTDIKLTFEPTVSYNMDIRHLNASLDLPDHDARIEKKTLNEEKKEYMSFGSVGKNPGNKKVLITAAGGSIYIR